MKTTLQNLYLGWLDLAEEDQRRAKEYLAQFKADNTLDELGFGILRDALADVFFPATNTIMTKTRYLVFLPALCLIVEKEKLSGAKAAHRLKDLEDGLRESLSGEESHSVIGAVAKENLRRYPSSIYWNSLRRLGIFLNANWGLGYYHTHLAQFYASQTPEKDDDGLCHLSAGERSNWDKELCALLAEELSAIRLDAPLPDSLNFSLTPHEATYLRSKYTKLAKAGEPVSILAYLVDKRYPEPFRYPWAVPHDPQLRPYVEHARRFSMFVRGATLQYYDMLQQERERQGIGQASLALADIFSEWFDATRQDLGAWDVEAFLTLATGLRALRRRDDGPFIKQWLILLRDAGSAPAMFANPKALDLIRRRERSTRPNKSRLSHPDYLKRWKPPEPAELDSMASDVDRLCFALDYRARIGNVFVRDIVDALPGAP